MAQKNATISDCILSISNLVLRLINLFEVLWNILVRRVLENTTDVVGVAEIDVFAVDFTRCFSTEHLAVASSDVYDFNYFLFHIVLYV